MPVDKSSTKVAYEGGAFSSHGLHSASDVKATDTDTDSGMASPTQHFFCSHLGKEEKVASSAARRSPRRKPTGYVNC